MNSQGKAATLWPQTKKLLVLKRNRDSGSDDAEVGLFVCTLPNIYIESEASPQTRSFVCIPTNVELFGNNVSDIPVSLQRSKHGSQ